MKKITGKSIFVLMCLLNSNLNYSQQIESLKEDFKSKSSTFLIKTRNLSTQKYADYADSLNKNQVILWQPTDSILPDILLPPPPPPPPLSVHDERYYTILKITPQSIVSFSLFKQELLNDTILVPEITSYKKIDRKDTTVVYFFPLKFETTEQVKLIYDDVYEESLKSEFHKGYSIKEIDKNNRKNFAGYDCYFVLFQSNNFPDTIVETYVSDEISIEYHPFFNQKKYLMDFYPLYLKKIIDQKFPDDSFIEITFFEY